MTLKKPKSDRITNTDENGFYSIDLPNLEMENGNFSGSVKIYYYIHNYKVFHLNGNHDICNLSAKDTANIFLPR